MVSQQSQQVVDRAKALYESALRAELETQANGQFVAIEPESGDYFIAATFDEAVNAACAKHPGRLCHALRIGHAAALNLGVAEY